MARQRDRLVTDRVPSVPVSQVQCGVCSAPYTHPEESGLKKEKGEKMLSGSTSPKMSRNRFCHPQKRPEHHLVHYTVSIILLYTKCALKHIFFFFKLIGCLFPSSRVYMHVLKIFGVATRI